MEVLDDGGGPAIYAVIKTPGASPRMKKWNGIEWSSVGSPLRGYATGLTTFDEGAGRALYACGQFFWDGPFPQSGIAKWDGARWSPFGAGMAQGVGALASFDDGAGPALYASGNFVTGGDPISAYMAKWYRPRQPCR
jgi:hypothetical protein